MEEAKQKNKINNLSRSQVFVARSLWVICRNVSRSFAELLFGGAILVHQYGQYGFGAPMWPPEINKNIWSSLFLEKFFLFTRELAYVHINISSNTWNGYTAENQEERLFFNETAFQFWCHALLKLGSSNCCICEVKHATGLESCTKIYFFVYL